MNDIVKKQMFRSKYTRQNSDGENIKLYFVNYKNFSVEVGLYGAYLLSFYNRDTLMKDCANLLSVNPEGEILFNYRFEPFVMATFDHIFEKEHYTWFDFFHSFSKKYDIEPNKISFLSANHLVTSSYDLWCEKNNIKKKIKVFFTDDAFWLRRWFDTNLRYNNIDKVKKISMLIGKPRLQKNYFVEWYIDNILDTNKENDIMISCLYGNLEKLHYNTDKKYIEKSKLLPGMIESPNITEWSQKTIHWRPIDLDDDLFSNTINQSLMFLSIDYMDLEDFSSVKDYENFFKNNTWWQEDHISEKTYLPIILKMPFLRMGMPGSLKFLRNLGYKTFDGILFDESYDEIDDFKERFNFIIDQVNKILDTPFEELKEKFFSKEVQDIVEHNYNLAVKKGKNMENINV